MLKNDPGLAGVGIAKAFNKQTNNRAPSTDLELPCFTKQPKKRNQEKNEKTARFRSVFRSFCRFSFFFSFFSFSFFFSLFFRCFKKQGPSADLELQYLTMSFITWHWSPSADSELHHKNIFLKFFNLKKEWKIKKKMFEKKVKISTSS